MADRLTTEELDELERLHREAKRGAWYRTCTGELPLTHGAAMTFGDACLVTGAINTLPRLIAAAREAERLRAASTVGPDRHGTKGADPETLKRVVFRLLQVADVVSGYTGSDPEAKDVAAYAAMRIRGVADEFLPEHERTRDVTCRRCAHCVAEVCAVAHEQIREPDLPFPPWDCSTFVNRYPPETDHE